MLKSYQNDTGETNPYQDFRSYYGKFYSLIHDGIQKFAKELNGVYVRALSSSTKSTISLVPWSLTEIPRVSLNSRKLVSHLIHLISTICPVKENAYVSVRNHMSNQVAENRVISHLHLSILSYASLYILMIRQFNWKLKISQLSSWLMDVQQT